MCIRDRCAQDPGVAVVEPAVGAALGPQLALDEAPSGDQPAQCVANDRRAQAQPGCDGMHPERPVASSESGHQVAQRLSLIHI